MQISRFRLTLNQEKNLNTQTYLKIKKLKKNPRKGNIFNLAYIFMTSQIRQTLEL